MSLSTKIKVEVKGSEIKTTTIGIKGKDGSDAPKIHSGLDLDDGTNPHGTTKEDVGLGNVDDTSDKEKTNIDSWQQPVISTTNFGIEEPANPSVGDRYIAESSDAGNVTGQSFTTNYIYEWNGIDWTEIVPQEGWAVFNKELNKPYLFESGEWKDTVVLSDTENVFTEKQLVDAELIVNDKLGIGTDDPQALLHLKRELGAHIKLESGAQDINIYFAASGNKYLLGFDQSPRGFRLFNYTTFKVILFNPYNSNNIGIGTTAPKARLDVQGGVRIGDDTDVATIYKVGTIRYRVDANNSYVEMCMQTGASTYAWEIIKTKTW